MKNVALYNLGCKVNSYETELMRQMFQEKGYEIVPFDKTADIYIVNTCTVTGIADRKSRQLLHRARRLNPQAVVVAVGCYVQAGGGKDDSIDLAVGNDRKKDIVEMVEGYLAGREEVCCGEEHTPYLKRSQEHTRTYIKIQEGCNQFCSYCIIPYVRGRIHSRSQEDILREIQAVVQAGCREVVLTGIHISSYGLDLEGGKADGDRLLDLIERIHEMKGVERIRLGSLEPRIIRPETARRLAALPGLCPHFHLSLQSGCDATLKRMNRHYTSGEYFTSVEILREYFDRPAITTDVIVGFPGETQEEFCQTREFLEKVSFYEMHIFKYSSRQGTRAADMPGQVPEQVKARRSGELLALEAEQSREFRRHYIGQEAEVLLEERRELEGHAFWVGHTKDYVKVAVEEASWEGRLGANILVRVPVSKFLTDEILR